MEQKILEAIEVEVLDFNTSSYPELQLVDSFNLRLRTNYEEAKEIFRASLCSYKEGMGIYTMAEHASEYIEMMKDMQGLYSHCLILETGKGLISRI